MRPMVYMFLGAACVYAGAHKWANAWLMVLLAVIALAVTIWKPRTN